MVKIMVGEGVLKIFKKIKKFKKFCRRAVFSFPYPHSFLMKMLMKMRGLYTRHVITRVYVPLT